jgi:hypothetical protein
MKKFKLMKKMVQICERNGANLCSTGLHKMNHYHSGRPGSVNPIAFLGLACSP